MPLAVLNGEVVAGTVRSSTLELLEREGKLKSSDLRIINQKVRDQLPLVHSTRLYPDWPLARLAHTNPQLCEKVAMALLSMPMDHPACQAAGHAGWTTPESYAPRCVSCCSCAPAAAPKPPTGRPWPRWSRAARPNRSASRLLGDL